MTRAHQGKERIPLAEWIAAAVGAVLVLGTVAWLVADLVRAEDAPPPAISLHVDSITRGPASYVVSISAQNSGGHTAAAVHVEGDLLDAGANVVERSEATLDYLPRQSQRQLGLFFQKDPAQYRLQLRATGYSDP